MALALVAVMALGACGDGDDGGSSEAEDPATSTAPPLPEPTESSSSATDEEQASSDWYRNPADVLAAEMWRQEYPDGIVLVDDDDPAGSCGAHPTNLVVLTAFADDQEAALDAVAAVLAGDGSPPDVPRELASGLWLYTVSDGGDVLVPLRLARAINGDQALTELGVRASPDHEMFPMPGRMYFPGNLPGPAADATPTFVGGSGTQTVHVIDTGLVPDLGLPDGIDDGDVEPDTRAPAQQATDPGPIASLVAGHGTFIAGVIRQESDARVVSWAVPEDGAGRFFESDVLDAAGRLRAVDSGSTITNLSLGTVVCRDGGGGAEDAPGYPLLSLFGLSELLTYVDTGEVLTYRGSVLLAAAGNTAGLGDREVYPAAFTVSQFPDLGCSEVRCDDLYDAIEQRREQFAASLVAVGAVPGERSSEYSSTGDYVTINLPGCHTSFFPRGTVRYVAGAGSYPDVDLAFLDATPGDDSASYSLADWCGTSFATAVASGRLAAKLGTMADESTPADALEQLGWKPGGEKPPVSP